MSISVCENIKPLREQIAAWRKQGETIAFVPTMGNLHAGHLSLVEIAAQKASRVVVSIYVNPLQFSPEEDFDSYPRTLQQDLDKLDHAGVDLVFIPHSSVIYPEGEHNSTFVEVPGLSHIIEGEFRPGFFRGVATVVLKLFNMVQPDLVVFGEKDFQQLLVIRKMVHDLNLPIEIVGAEIKREADGLAMSSRNSYLNFSDREKSRVLSAALQQCRVQLEQGKDITQAEQVCIETLLEQGFIVDYVSLREAATLTAPEGLFIDAAVTGEELIILAAVKIGSTRLIDNVKFIAGESAVHKT